MSWKHLSDRTVKARKVHHCELCERPIAVGESHVNRTGVQDGDIRYFRMHVACEALTRSWGDDDWECHDAQEFRRLIDGKDEPECLDSIFRDDETE